MLLEEGHQVTVLDNFLYGQNSLALHCGNPDFEVHKVDCRDLNAVRPHLNHDVIIPLASLVGAPLCNQNLVDAELLNLRGPIELFKALGSQYVVMPTTESSYGANSRICTEETTLNPLSTYAKHKVAVENALLERGNCVSLRLATVFGMSPRMRLDLLVNDFTWRALKDRAFVVFEGKYRRTCVHVSDVARAMIHALGLSGVYNVGSVTLTKLSLCEAIKRHIPDFIYVEAPVGTDPDQRDYIVSDAKIRETGFIPQVSLDDGIKELLKGFKTLKNTVYGNV
jgi:nucleoside-diphosphate-sugar epimerase